MGTTRRDILRRGAVVGAGVWAAPVLTSVAVADGAVGSREVCGTVLCGSPPQGSCPTGCTRARTAEGDCVCVRVVATCARCATSADCDTGFRCAETRGCCPEERLLCFSPCD